MTISVFNLFSIGIGPSSSHTVGPMKAAHAFIESLNLALVSRVKVELFGSLAFTGKGHGTDGAILLGLEGNLPDTVDPDVIRPRMQHIMQEQQINLGGKKLIPFHLATDLEFNFKDVLPTHTNGMRFTAYDKNNQELSVKIYYSIGGGFIICENEETHLEDKIVPYPFSTTIELLDQCEKNGLTIKEVMLANESSLRSEKEVKERLLKIAKVMRECIDKGCHASGILPGGLNVKRRAPGIFAKLNEKGRP
jgi:L-serine dehydratase